jgi:hypothetical protein
MEQLSESFSPLLEGLLPHFGEAQLDERYSKLHVQYHDKSVRQATSKSPISNTQISHLNVLIPSPLH